MRISILFEKNLGLSSLATTKIMSGANATALLLFFVAALFGFWFLVSMVVEKHCPLHQVDCKNAFCQGILPPEEVTLFDLPWVIPRLSQMNIGFFSRLFMAFTAALDIGTRKST
jgi:hypothetical protein